MHQSHLAYGISILSVNWEGKKDPQMSTKWKRLKLGTDKSPVPSGLLGS